MKKRVLTLALVLAMCLSLAIPAFAADDAAAGDKDPVATESVKPEDKDTEPEDKDPEPSNSAETPDDKDPDASEPAEDTDDKDPEPSESTNPEDGEADPSEPAAPAFTDVPEGIYYEKPVAWAVEKKITNGTEPTKFDPEVTCSQVQILTFLYRAVQSAENPDFTPTATDLINALLWAKEEGMIDDTFENNKDCTRVTAASYIWQAFGSPEVEVSDQFTDVDEADKAAVSWMLAKEITNGDGSDTIFSPDKTCTRGQIVTFLYRAYLAVEAETPVEPAE